MESAIDFEHLMWIYSTLVQAGAALVAVVGALLLFHRERRSRDLERILLEIAKEYPDIIREHNKTSYVDTLLENEYDTLHAEIERYEEIESDSAEKIRKGKLNKKGEEALERVQLMDSYLKTVDRKLPDAPIGMLVIPTLLSAVLLAVREQWWGYLPTWLVYAIAWSTVILFGIGVWVVYRSFRRVIKGES